MTPEMWVTAYQVAGQHPDARTIVDRLNKGDAMIDAKIAAGEPDAVIDRMVTHWIDLLREYEPTVTRLANEAIARM